MWTPCTHGKYYCRCKELLLEEISDSDCRYAPSSTWILWTSGHLKYWKSSPSRSSDSNKSTKLSQQFTGSKHLYDIMHSYMTSKAI